MDKSKIFQPSQEHNLGNGLIDVNLFNGRMLYSYPIGSIGSGNYKIDASLVYNSFYKSNDFGNLKFGFGNGWKFNFEEFIFKYSNEYNIDGFNSQDYVYIDSKWSMHRFVKLKDCEGYDTPGSVYFDESGTGLKLIVSKNSNYKIFDEYGNTYYFDKESGKLVTIISGINSLIMKNIEYDEKKENVVAVYDTRKPQRRLEFNYQNNLLVKITSTNSNVYYTFEYDETRLQKINKENKKKKKTVHEFLYDNTLINYIINSENLKAMNLQYDVDKINPQLNKIIFGVMKVNNNVEYTDAEVFCNDDVYLGEHNYSSKIGKKAGKPEMFMPSKYIYTSISYDYHNSYTDVIDHKKNKNKIFFDVNGQKISSLEYSNEKQSEEHLYTASKPVGWKISENGDSQYYINNSRAYVVNKLNQKYVFKLTDENLTSFKKIFDNDSEKFSEHFTLSFWIMFNQINDTNLIADLKYTLNDKIESSKVIIKDTLGDSWQYVSIPLNLGTNQVSINNISINFEEKEDLELSNDKIFIADVRIAKGNRQVICIDNLKSNDKSYKELTIGSKLYYYDTYEREVTLSPSFYLTESDIIATYRSLYYSKVNDDLYFELFYCNKTKIKSVTYVSLLPFYLTEDLSIRNDHKYYSFDFAEYGEDGIRRMIDTPNYHFRSIDLISLNEGKKSYRVSEIQRKIKVRDNNRFSFETYTLIGVVDDNNEVQRLDETNSVCNVVEENDDGTETKKKYVKRVFGENNEIVKTINIITETEYDNFGNIKKIITMAEGGTSENLVKEYLYCEDCPEHNEYIKEVIEDGIIITANYNENGSINTIITQNDKIYKDGLIIEIPKTQISKIKYSYDDFENLIKFSFYDKNDNLYGENKLELDQCGNVKKYEDSSGVSYGIIHNSFSEIAEIYRNKKLIQKESTIFSTENDIHKLYVYQGDTSHLTTKNYDKYGRIISNVIESKRNNEVVETKKVEYEYEDNGIEFSKSIERIKKIIDPLSNRTYEYEYEEDEIEGETSKLIVKDNITTTTKSNGTKIHEIYGDLKKIKSITEKEDSVNNNPKHLYNYTCEANSDEWEINNNFSYDYEYDTLGRLILKKGKNDEYDQSIINISKDISYYDNSNLPKKINYNISSLLKQSNEEAISNITFENSYQNGNIIKVVESGKRFSQIPISKVNQVITNLETSTIDYEYDVNNRLVKETKSDGTVYMYTYGSSSGMIEKVSKNTLDNVCKSLEHVAGKLTKFNNDDIIYDNYGNIKQIGKVKFNYNSRNLMESYFEGDDSYSFEYNYNGIRTKKSKLNEYEVHYYLDESKVIGENLIDLQTNEIIRKFRYFYDENGICGITCIMNNEEKHYNLLKDSLGNISKVIYKGKVIGEYNYDAWGNCETILFEDANLSDIERYVVTNNPFRFKGYYLDLETGLYYCQTRYYSPIIYQWISPDSIEYLEPKNICGFSLYCYCCNDPIGGYDPTGTWSWKNFFKVVGAVAIVVGVTALSVVTCGAAAAALGASAAMISAVATGAAIGGLVAGGLEIGAQIYENGIEGMNLGSIAIESFSGAVYGAITGVASTTSSIGLRIAMRGARVALGGLTTALHGINEGDSFAEIVKDVGISIGTGLLIQGALVGLDAYTGKLSTKIMESYLIDGAFTFGTNAVLIIIGVLLGKSAWRNRKLIL